MNNTDKEMKNLMLILIAIVLLVSVNFTKLVRGIKRTKKFVRNNKAGRKEAEEHALMGEFQNTEYVFYKMVKVANDRSGKQVFMMSISRLPNPDQSVEAYLVIPHNHGKAVVLMNGIITKCTGNIYVTTPTLQLTAATTLISNYNDAHGAARKVTLDLAVDALEVIMAAFQAFSQLPANKANSIVILQSGGFHVKGIGGSHASTWDAVTGKLPGEVDMTFITGEGTCCYDNWYSTDNILWVRMDPTIYNHATLTGLIPGSYIWVRYQLCDAHGPEGYHPAIKVRVAPIV